MTNEELFAQAIEIADGAKRERFLDKACQGDSTRRQQLAKLISAHFDSGELLFHQNRDFIGAVVERLVSEPDSIDLTIELADDARKRFAILRKPSSELSPEETVAIRQRLEPSDFPDSWGRLHHYEMLEMIGRGGCGMVFRAYDQKLYRTVAIKWMSPELMHLSPARKRFLREARATAAVTHQNVVRVYAVEEHPVPFLVMEYVEGHTLQDRLDQHGPLDLTEVIRLAPQIAEGLAASHAQGLIHRDIKPSNILVDRTTGQAKITDFGLARTAEDASLTHSGVITGTPLYMSPEQAQGHTVDQRSDLFGLGSVLYAMVTGRPPFRAPNAMAVLKRVVEDQARPIHEIIPDVPQWLVTIIEKLHAKSPTERFDSAQTLLAEWQSKLESSNAIIAALAPTHATVKNAATSQIDQPKQAQQPETAYAHWPTISLVPSIANRKFLSKRLSRWLLATVGVGISILITSQAFRVENRSSASASIDASSMTSNEQPAISDYVIADKSVDENKFLDYRIAMGITEKELIDWSDGLGPNHQISWLSPRHGEEPVRFDAIALPSPDPIRPNRLSLYHDVWIEGPDQDFSKFEPPPNSPAGVQPVFRTMWGRNVALIWAESTDEWSYWYSEKSSVDAEIANGIASRRLRNKQFERFLPVSLNVNHVDNTLFYEVVQRYLPYENADCLWGLSEQELIAHIEAYRKDGWRPHLISTHAGTSDLIFTAAFVKSTAEETWEVSFGISSDELQTERNERQTLGQRPRCLLSWNETSHPKYLVVWDGMQSNH